MQRADYLFTSESVSEGHPGQGLRPDLRRGRRRLSGADPDARVACETLATTNRIVIAGEVRGPGAIRPTRSIAAAPREAIRDIGYEQEGFHWRHAKVEMLPARPVRRHRPGRRRRRQQGRGRRRPGHHVRLRLQRDPGADAGADPATRTRSCAGWRRPATAGQAAAARARRQEPGHASATPTASRSASTSVVVSTQHATEA